MSTHNNINKICVVVIIVGIIITVLFMNGEKLGLIKDTGTEEWTGDTTSIVLNGDDIESASTNAAKDIYFNSGNLYIVNSGYYKVSGALNNGSIIVDANKNSKVYLSLEGVSINCEEDACIKVNQAKKVYLILAEGTENELKSGDEYSKEAKKDGCGGVIYAHDDLIIQGDGELKIDGEYKHGIEANDDLVIEGGKLIISAPKKGIKVNELLNIKAGTITINSCTEGLEAPNIEIEGGDLLIYPSDDGINASGGSDNGFPMQMDMKGGPGGGPGGELEDQPDRETVKGSDKDSKNTSDKKSDKKSEESSDEEKPYVHITGGNITIINPDGRDADGIDSNGDIIIDGGNVYIYLNGDGPNNALDYGSESGGVCKINGGNVFASGGSQMAEEISSESSQVSIMYMAENTIESGTAITLKSGDDTIITQTPECNSTCIILSSPLLKTGETYTLIYGDTEEEITVTNIATKCGTENAGGFGGRMGGMPGNMPEGIPESIPDVLSEGTGSDV